MISHFKKLVQSAAFGEIGLSEKEKYLYEQLNSCISFLCKSLPEHIQNSAMLFMLNYSNIKIGEPLDFFRNFYKPVWTIIPAIAESEAAVRELNEPEYRTAILGHAMALFLHSLDDHLNDGQLEPSHLLLLLRSQAWLLFNEAIKEFAYNEDETDLAYSLINDYYKGIDTDKEPSTLDEYRARFLNEISTVYIFPMLSAEKISGSKKLAYEIKKAVEFFGTAWRILDDIQDMEEDLASGTHSAVYLSLAEETKRLWDTAAEKKKNGNIYKGIREDIFRELLQGRIIEGLTERIIEELDRARKTAEVLGMYGLAEQYDTLGEPIIEMIK